MAAQEEVMIAKRRLANKAMGAGDLTHEMRTMIEAGEAVPLQGTLTNVTLPNGETATIELQDERVQAVCGYNRRFIVLYRNTGDIS